MKWVKRGILIVLVLGLAGAIAYGFMPKPVPSEFANVVRGHIRVTIDEEGMTRVKDRFTVTVPLTGAVSRIELKAGDNVGEGALITTLKPSEPALLDARAEREAQAGIKAAEAGLSRAESDVRAAKSELDLAEKELTRARDLFKGRHVSREQVDIAETRTEAAEAALASATFARQAAQFHVEMAQATLISSNEGAELAAIEIRSPVAGRVLKVYREHEGMAAPGEMLVEIGNPESLEVVVDLLSRDAVRVSPGMEVVIERWGGDEPLAGKVRVIEPSGFTKVSALGVEEQRVNVVIDFTSAREAWRALGDRYRVEARVITVTRPNVIKVPNSAIFNTTEGPAVFLVQAGRARVKRIETGRRTGIESEILEGLKEGDTVVIHPGDDIEDGTAVEER